MLYPQLAALFLVATTLVTSGCGGSSETKSGTTAAADTTPATAARPSQASATTEIVVATGKSLTRAEWVAKGDAICASTNTKRHSTTARTTNDLTRLLPQAAGYERIEATELSKLVPPTSMRSDWIQIVSGIQKFSEYSIKVSEYTQAHNFSAAAPVVVAGTTIERQLTAIAKRDGFKKCSRE